MNYVAVVTGASSGFGALAARALARAGHTVYASMRETKGRNVPAVDEIERYAQDHGVDLRAIELDVGSDKSCETAIQYHGPVTMQLRSRGYRRMGHRRL